MPRREDLWEDYLGDGLYASFDGFQIYLSANDRCREAGRQPTDVVALEPSVIVAFERYLKRLREKGVPI